MIALIDLRNRSFTADEFSRIVPRSLSDVSSATTVAEQLIADVRAHGESALLDQAERLDGIRPANVRVAAADIARALTELAPEVRAALDEAIARVRVASRAQIPPPSITELSAGAFVTQRWQPVKRVGLYVPGGKAVYPSSVVMNVVPAQIAGVSSVALASPAQREFGGSVHPTILAAAGLLGIDEVYAMGGAGAIGAFAYGVRSIGLEPVQVITGPGNVYVAAAKRLVRGTTGIDSEAGPTEILIIADESADPSFVAADLISQAEHDELAAAVLVTDSLDLATAVRSELAVLSQSTHHSERVREALAGPQSAIVIVDDLSVAAQFSNAYGPEHLELQTRDPAATLELIDSAGAIFLGPYSPVSLGDYLAGSNHVLPTGGQARFASGLGTYTFLRPQQIIQYDRHALSEVHDRIVVLSSAENLPAHGAAVTRRFQGQ